MEQYCFEGLFTHLFKSGEDHTDYPEEDNIVSCYQYICWVKILQILCHFRPTQGGERPEGRRKPGIQRIRVLLKMGTTTFWTYGRHFFCYDCLATLLTVVCRNSVAPPKLSADTPVSDVICPVVVCFFHTFRNQFDVTLFYRFYGRFDQLIHLHEPLFFYHRLDGGLTSVMGTYVMAVILDFNQQS